MVLQSLPGIIEVPFNYLTVLSDPHSFGHKDERVLCVLLQYLPGIIATLALIMINLIRRDELAELDPFDDASYCR